MNKKINLLLYLARGSHWKPMLMNLLQRQNAGRERKPRLVVLISVIPLLIAGCASVKVSPDYPEIQPQIRELAILKPVVYIEKITNQGRFVDYEGIEASSHLIPKSLEEAMGGTYQVKVLDGPMQTKDKALNEEVAQFFREARKNAHLENIPVPDGLVKYAQRFAQRFYTLVLQVGFKRSDENMASEDLKTLGIGLLTLGMAIPYAIPATSDFYFLLMDKQSGYPVYFGFQRSEASPMNEDVIRRQVSQVLTKLLGKEAFADPEKRKKFKKY